LINVRVFDGQQLRGPETVVIDGTVIGADPAGARVIDCDSAVLLPGLIDAHVHFSSREELNRLTAFGVTTALDMDAFVDRWIAAGADYIKIIATQDGFDQPTLTAIVAAAHKHGKVTIAHAATFADIAMAPEAQIDVVTHAPLDRALDDSAVAKMVADHSHLRADADDDGRHRCAIPPA
jgi:imidazolonepropionase-like amidohydrolase